MFEEFQDAMSGLTDEAENQRAADGLFITENVQTADAEELSLVTGKLAYPYIKEMAEIMMRRFPRLNIHVYAITNDFFGELITVSGLLTGRDIIEQLKGKALGERILLPQNVLRSGEDYFLDDITISDMEKALQVKVGVYSRAIRGRNRRGTL